MRSTDDNRREFGVRFSIYARRWRRRVDERLANWGMTDATWLPLVHLDAIGTGCTQKHLAERIGIDSSSLVRLLDILTRKGLVERRPDPRDARARHVMLTPEAKAFMADLRQQLWEEEAEMLADVSDADLAVALRVLDQINGRIQKMAEGAPRP